LAYTVADAQNLDAWKAAQEAIKDIPPHPNQPPESALPVPPAHIDATPTMARGSSFARGPTEYRADVAYGQQIHEGSSATSPGQGGSGAGKEPLDLTGVRGEIDRVDAANVPLPLPDGEGMEASEAAEGKGKGKAREDPLGPLQR
jgi:hypothetical protein